MGASALHLLLFQHLSLFLLFLVVPTAPLCPIFGVPVFRLFVVRQQKVSIVFGLLEQSLHLLLDGLRELVVLFLYPGSHPLFLFPLLLHLPQFLGVLLLGGLVMLGRRQLNLGIRFILNGRLRIAIVLGVIGRNANFFVHPPQTSINYMRITH